METILLSPIPPFSSKKVWLAYLQFLNFYIPCKSVFPNFLNYRYVPNLCSISLKSYLTTFLPICNFPLMKPPSWNLFKAGIVLNWMQFFACLLFHRLECVLYWWKNEWKSGAFFVDENTNITTCLESYLFKFHRWRIVRLSKKTLYMKITLCQFFNVFFHNKTKK